MAIDERLWSDIQGGELMKRAMSLAVLVGCPIALLMWQDEIEFSDAVLPTVTASVAFWWMLRCRRIVALLLFIAICGSAASLFSRRIAVDGIRVGDAVDGDFPGCKPICACPVEEPVKFDHRWVAALRCYIDHWAGFDASFVLVRDGRQEEVAEHDFRRSPNESGGSNRVHRNGFLGVCTTRVPNGYRISGLLRFRGRGGGRVGSATVSRPLSYMQMVPATLKDDVPTIVFAVGDARSEIFPGDTLDEFARRNRGVHLVAVVKAHFGRRNLFW